MIAGRARMRNAPQSAASLSPGYLADVSRGAPHLELTAARRPALLLQTHYKYAHRWQVATGRKRSCWGPGTAMLEINGQLHSVIARLIVLAKVGYG